MMNPIFKLVDMALDIYGLFVFIYIILRLLAYFQVINAYQPFVARVIRMLADIVEPALNYIRKYVPPFNSVDLSPVILILLINFVQYSLYYITVNY